MDHSREFLELVNDAKRRVTEVTVDDVQARRARGERFRLIDVREDDEWRAGHARGAEHLGRGVLERDVVGKVPDKSEELILYCGGGFRSALAADNLLRMGYTRVRSLAGGWKEWLARGLPTEK
ncbi:MAG TPA: rhodanese-like domain-containing protein [Polyangia bacterium]|nr:rhodanese-like domain-containing protein [Polyangia bacterium]